MNVEELTAHRERTRLLYEAAATIRCRLDKAAEDFQDWPYIDGDAEVWGILKRENGWSVTVASLETARAEAHETAKAEVDEGYDFDDDEEGEESPDEPGVEPAVASVSAPATGPLSRIAGMLAAAAATVDANHTDLAEEGQYETDIKAARAKVDALYDTARDILLYLGSLPPEHPFHGDSEDVCVLVDENDRAELIEAEQHDKLARIDAALKMRASFQESVTGIVAEAKQRRAQVRNLAGERGPSKAAEQAADRLEASWAEEAILELFTGEAS
jgi:hypothetical protein